MTLEKYRFDGAGTFNIQAFATAPPEHFQNKKELDLKAQLCLCEFL